MAYNSPPSLALVLYSETFFYASAKETALDSIIKTNWHHQN